MAIDFFNTACQTKTSESVFGIYDAPPATLVFSDEADPNVWVDNDKKKEVTHTAVDKCLNIPRAEGERCESIITYEDVIIFIELKKRDGGRWVGKSRDQLTNTIALFKRDANLNGFRRCYGHIANNLRPRFKAGNGNLYQEFEDETGFILRISDVIEIE